MHYDEYEISMRREINFCRRVIKGLKADLLKRERQYGMSTEQFLSGTAGGLPPDGHPDIERWRGDHRQLHEWEQRLRDYEKALGMVIK